MASDTELGLGASHNPDGGQQHTHPPEEHHESTQAQPSGAEISASRHAIDPTAPTATFKDGYPNLAFFQSADESLAMYRSYNYLQARLLLEKQDELRVLEDRLDAHDWKDHLRQTRHGLQPDHEFSRKALLQDIEHALTSYAHILDISRRMRTFRHPSTFKIREVQKYLEYCCPRDYAESEYAQHADDLIALQDSANSNLVVNTLVRWSNAFLDQTAFLRRPFRSDNGNASPLRTRERSAQVASLVASLTVSLLLVTPISILYYISSSTSGLRRAVASIGVLMAFTLLFTFLTSRFTSARRHEVTAASAAYCAVLAVFFGNVS